jgi:hypothetical protein
MRVTADPRSESDGGETDFPAAGLRSTMREGVVEP